jgi:aspartate/methionine/tyrosine aminotransferase
MALGPPIARHEVVSRAVERLLAESAAAPSLVTKGGPDAELPEHVVAAAAKAAAANLHAPSSGELELRVAIAERLVAEGIDAEPERVVVSNGAMQALEICFRVLLRGGGAVVVPEPRFFIGPLVHQAGGVLQGFDSPEEDGYRPDWAAGAAAVDSDARALFVNSPVNPTGYVFTDDDNEAALALAQAHDLWLISDESYAHFVYGGRRHLSPARLDGARDRVVLIRSFSKDYAMSGWRLGYALLPPALVDPFARALEWSCLSVNRVAQMAVAAALTGPDDWVRAFVADAQRRATWVWEALDASAGLSCSRPDGGMNVLLRPSISTDRLVEHLLQRERVAVQPGGPFGAPDHFRFQFGGDEATVRAAVRRIVSAAETLGCEDRGRDGDRV